MKHLFKKKIKKIKDKGTEKRIWVLLKDFWQRWKPRTSEKKPQNKQRTKPLTVTYCKQSML